MYFADSTMLYIQFNPEAVIQGLLQCMQRLQAEM